MHDYDNGNAVWLLKSDNPKNIYTILYELFTGKKKPHKICPVCANKAYELISQSLISHIGYSKEYVRKLYAEADIAEREIEYILTGNAFAQTEANTLRDQYNSRFATSDEKQNIWSLIYELSQHTGTQLDAKKETLLNVYKWRQEIEKNIRTKAKSNKKEYSAV